MQRITFISFKGETQTVDVDDKFIPKIMQAIENQKIVNINGGYYKSAYYDSCKKIKNNNILQLPEVEITDEQRKANCQKLKDFKNKLRKQGKIT